MDRDLREQACWLLLAFESGLTTRTINDVLIVWCKQLGRTLQDFFAADARVWAEVCQLPDKYIQRLELARKKLARQVSIAGQLLQERIAMLTVLDPDYPRQLKMLLGRSHLPPVLFILGDLAILRRQTIAIIGSRNANETSLAFTTSITEYLSTQGVNVISGHARGVDRAAFDAVNNTNGHTTVVLPHGIRKLSKTQMQQIQPRIQSGHVLLLSQFHPDASWMVSRAMERNNVVTSLAQIVIVAEADNKGGTWHGALGALHQGRPLYARQAETPETLAGTKLLIEKGARPLPWPTTEIAALCAPLLQESMALQQKEDAQSLPSDQHSLLASQSES